MCVIITLSLVIIAYLPKLTLSIKLFATQSRVFRWFSIDNDYSTSITSLDKYTKLAFYNIFGKKCVKLFDAIRSL